jgi:V/A-type H+-transporting ATPase subunit B
LQFDYKGLKGINGPLVIVEGVSGVGYEELCTIKLNDGTERLGRVIEVNRDKAVVQVFEGTAGLSLSNNSTSFIGKPMELGVSRELLGRIFNGMGKPVDGMGNIFVKKYIDINGYPINPVSRQYPKNYIHTGISSIDMLMTLIRGQKLPIFSGSGMSHNQLAAQIVRQAQIGSDANFAIVFAAMGVKHDVAEYFIKEFTETGVIQKLVVFQNLSNDPISERIMVPRLALTAAEYLAFELNMHILVILTDMTSYAEALRELSSSKGEIPGRKGYPGYLYSDFASIYERAGMVYGSTGSVTQIPILTMPNDDITNPVPNLTGYITEGQIVLDRGLEQKGIYPSISVLSSLSRLMKDGIGKDYTREDHAPLANQLFSSYSKVQAARSLASVIGEEEISELDKKYLTFGNEFEKKFLSQAPNEARSMEYTLNLGWKLLRMLPREELDRLDEKLKTNYYDSQPRL